MKPVKVIVVAILSTVFTIACAKYMNTNSGTSPAAGTTPAGTATSTPDEFASTRPIFKEDCAKCHGDNGDGGPVTIDGKKLRVPSFKSGHALKHSDQDFVDQIVTGGDGMPAFKGKLDPKQINDFVRFIRKEFQHK